MQIDSVVNCFYANVTTLRAVLLQIRLLSVCLSSICNVRAPYSGVKAFGNISSPLCTLTILWPLCKILRRLSQGSPSVGHVKHKRGSK